MSVAAKAPATVKLPARVTKDRRPVRAAVSASVSRAGRCPLIRRIPKRGFNNKDFATRYAPVNLDALEAFPDGSKVDEATLRARGLVKGSWDGVKLLGGGKLKPKNLTLEVHAVSGSAKTALEAAGGKLTLLKS